jgi:hypothetical protein
MKYENMTVKELHETLTKVIAEGYGSAEVYFDSEAARFNVHFVNIQSGAFLEKKEHTGLDRDMFILYYNWGNTPIER